MKYWKSVRIGCAAAALALLVGASAHAWGVTHENKLTFNRAVSLPGVVLPAGAYSFGRAGTNSPVNLVVVRNAGGEKLYTGFTNIVQRPRNMSPNALITFGEASASEPSPIAVWYPIGESIGHEFLYR